MTRHKYEVGLYGDNSMVNNMVIIEAEKAEAFPECYKFMLEGRVVAIIARDAFKYMREITN